MTSPVIAAIDLGPSSSRVLLHAAGFARMWSAPLRVLYVSADPPNVARQRVADFCNAETPYEIDLNDDDVIVRAGLVSESIHREAVKQQARLIVMGSRRHSGLVKWLLGSTCEAVLSSAPAPVLIVPSSDVDVVNITDRATLTCGPILVPIDLDEDSGEQLRIAGDLAHLARQPLLMMTVSPRSLTDHVAGERLRQRAHDSAAVKPRSLIVRRGDIAEEISQCALTEDCGLVVMGLRAKARRRAGVIASAVLRTNRAFVLAVPAA